MTTLLVALPGVQSGDGIAGVAAGQQPAAQGSGAPAQLKSGLVSAGLVYETASFPSAHASTIVETGDGLVAAWFGGTGEGRPDVGIWVSRHERGAWTPPVEVATGVQPDGTRHPCWNPVLFDDAGQDAVALLQSRPEPADVVGHGSLLSRQRANVVRRAASARRHPRSDQEQAGAALRRHADQPEQHRVHRGGRAHGGSTSSAVGTAARRGRSCALQPLRRGPQSTPSSPAS